MSDWNERIITEFRTTGTTQMFGDSLVVMHTVGARSGDSRLAPVAGFPEGDGWLVIASAAGAPKDPAWAHNLRAATAIDVEVSDGAGGVTTVPVAVAELPEPERSTEWERLATLAPGFREYTKKTDRPFPIFRLSPLA